MSALIYCPRLLHLGTGPRFHLQRFKKAGNRTAANLPWTESGTAESIGQFSGTWHFCPQEKSNGNHICQKRPEGNSFPLEVCLSLWIWSGKLKLTGGFTLLFREKTKRRKKNYSDVFVITSDASRWRDVQEMEIFLWQHISSTWRKLRRKRRLCLMSCGMKSKCQNAAAPEIQIRAATTDGAVTTTLTVHTNQMNVLFYTILVSGKTNKALMECRLSFVWSPVDVRWRISDQLSPQIRNSCTQYT